MRRRQSFSIGLTLALGLALGGCAGFGLDSFDGLFNSKKPLPGDRKAVFPDGVPGVPQGVPPELVSGYQPPAEPEPQPVVAEQPKAKPKPKPRPKQVAAPARPATAITVQPAAQTATQRPVSASPFPPPPPPPAQ